MSNQEYERVFSLLSPALKRIATDEEFRAKLEADPLAALDEMNLEVDADIAADLEGVTFSQFWEAHRKKVEGPGALRDLPPNDHLSDHELSTVVAGGNAAALREQKAISSFAPPYVPVGPGASNGEGNPKVTQKFSNEFKKG